MNQLSLTPQALANKGDYRGALRLYIHRYRIHRSQDDLSNIAACLYKIGHYRKALSFAEKAIQVSPENAAAATLIIANIHYDYGEFHEAIRLYLRLTNTDLAVSAYEGMANIMQKRGRTDRSIRLLKLVSHRFSHNHRAHLLLAQSYIEAADYHRAWSAIRQSLASDDSCIEGWKTAYRCANELREYNTCLSIAEKIVALDSGNPKSYEFLGRAFYNLDKPDECSNAYKMALKIDPKNLIYFLNSKILFSRIPATEASASNLEKSILYYSSEAIMMAAKINEWKVDTSCSLLPFAYFCAYSDINLNFVYSQYYDLMTQAFESVIRNAKAQGDALLEIANTCKSKVTIRSERQDKDSGCRTRKIRLGMASRFFSAHSNSQAFIGLIKRLNRDDFELILIHRHGSKIDSVHLRLNDMADEIVYLDNSLGFSAYLLSSLSLDILFFTDIGMDPFDFLLAELQRCSIQITGWGLPHTSGLKSVHYYLSSSNLELPSHQSEYSERLILLDGLPCCYISSEIFYRHQSRDYFLLPADRLIIGCIQNFWKIHPDFDLILDRISLLIPTALFVFVETSIVDVNSSFSDRLSARAPNAHANSLFLSRSDTNDFLSLCDCIDILLDTPYYGAGVTSYMSMYVGTPVVCWRGKRLRDSTTAAIYSYLKISNAPIADNNDEYVNKVVELANNVTQRIQVKQETVNNAYKLYDNLDYVKSFESFCHRLVWPDTNMIPSKNQN
jgi:protein O-GlcNAc transferase